MTHTTMNTKQALQHLIGEVWEIGEMDGYGTEFSMREGSVKVLLYDFDGVSAINKTITNINADSVLELIDFLQANVKEG